MAANGRTLTPHFHIESRQHEVFNFDLGEGVPRKMLVFGLVVSGAWVLLMLPILGVPNKVTFSVYFLPPVLFSYFAYQDSSIQPRRKNLTQWAVRLRYMLTGHRPIVALGGRAAYRSEYLPLSERFPVERIVRFIAPWTARAAWEKDAADGVWADGEIRAGAPITLDQSAELIGFDYMQNLRGKNRGRRKKEQQR